MLKRYLIPLTLVIAACSATPGSTSKETDVKDVQLAPPDAEKQPNKMENHGDVRVDDYYWLRDRENPNVIAYLKAENEYTKAKTAHTDDEQKVIYDEMLSRIKETDLSAPYKKGEYFYYTKTIEGLNYEIHCRKKGSLNAPEEILLDENKEAEGTDYFAVGALEISPDGNLMAYSVDDKGNERYELRVRDLTTGKDFPDVIPNTYYSVEWANDSTHLFYNRVDSANRPWQVWRHALGSAAKDDKLVFQEDDDAYFVGVEKTRSDAYLMIGLRSAVTTEYRVLDASTPDGEFSVIQPRIQSVEYYIDHHSDHFYILTNADGATNFKLMQTPVAKPSKANWSQLIAHQDDVTLTGVDAFKNYLVIEERYQGLPRIRVRTLNGEAEHYVVFPEPTYAARTSTNYEFDTDSIRYTYTSLITPRSVFDWDMGKKVATLVKETEVFHYDRNDYVSERILAKSADGTEVPMSLVYKKDAIANGPAPVYMTGYGSYGASYDPYFSSSRVSLLNRGVVFAIAHIRGGGELGRKWKEDGKFLNKKNTFDDFIACAQHLIDAKYTAPERLAISGGSAGGLLMGAVVNMRPDLFHVVVADVPFVDVVTTMLDETIPLTVIEWEEWGNPNDKTYYDYIKSYSPYDNVEAKDYPHMLITAGLNDPRVGYWEPAKWTAKLRDLKTDDNWLVLKTNMDAGHGGASGRYDYLKEIAFEYAFVLDRLGIL